MSEIQLYSDALSSPVLSASLEGNAVKLDWNSINLATGYNVKRSELPGGPYSTIATNVTDVTYLDSSVSPGITYYYVVTAFNAAIESVNSNEVTIEKPSVPEESINDRAILTIYLSNGTEKEYDLLMTEVNAFIDWYDQKDTGVGPAKYAFTKAWNKGPFKKRTEYVIFDKILTFNVDEYSVEE